MIVNIGDVSEGNSEERVIGLEEATLQQDLSHSEGRGRLVCCSPWGHRVRHDFATEQQEERPSLSSKFILMESDTTSGKLCAWNSNQRQRGTQEPLSLCNM